MKSTDTVQLKCEMNRIKMQIYHHEKMSVEQKCKTKEYKEYNRKKAATYRLKKKELEQSKREKCRNRQQKCRLSQKSKLIPTNTKKFQKHIKAVCRIANKASPHKK